MSAPAYQPGETHSTDHGGALVLLVRVDALEEVESGNGEYMALRGDAYGALNAVLPGLTVNGMRSASVHDDEGRRLTEELLIEQRRTNELLLQLLARS